MVLIALCALLFSCSGNGGASKEEKKAEANILTAYDSVLALAEQYPDKIEIKYAKGLKVEYMDDGIHIQVSNPDPKAKRSKVEEFVVQPEGKKRFVCTTALQLGNFEVLGLEHCIVGINSLKSIFSPRVKEQIASNATKKVGKEGNFDREMVIALNPDYIFVSASKHGGFDALKDCGVPLVPHHGYKEVDPLGQAEWIKLVGLLTGETKRANAVFDYVEKEYLRTKQSVQELKDKGEKLPTVLSGRQLREGWYVMGGKSYMARLFSDAGAQYIMDDQDETGGVTLDFEWVYARGINADYWQIDGSFGETYTLADLAAEDMRYADVKAYKEGKVVFCNFTKTPYRELGAVAPHLMLADFVKAFHPELMSEHKPVFYDFIK